MTRMRRAVGYCGEADCEEFARGVFLLNHEAMFHCPCCRKRGRLEAERGSASGSGKVFKEVRVEYNFDPVDGVYREVAIVQDVSLWGPNSVYTLQSPLIRTEKRALKVAEAILANLNRCPEAFRDNQIPNTSEVVLSLDDPMGDFKKKLEALAEEWQRSGLRQL